MNTIQTTLISILFIMSLCILHDVIIFILRSYLINHERYIMKKNHIASIYRSVSWMDQNIIKTFKRIKTNLTKLVHIHISTINMHILKKIATRHY